jgi:hypothetical protein
MKTPARTSFVATRITAAEAVLPGVLKLAWNDGLRASSICEASSQKAQSRHLGKV